MTHDDWAAALPHYAAGELEDEVAEAVRAHLATGCTTCLGALFRFPVGRRAEPATALTVSPRRVSPLAPAVALLALGFAALVAFTIFDLREREKDRRTEAERLATRIGDVEAGRREALARLHATESELDAARAETTSARQAAAAALEARQELERSLAAAEERVGTLERGVRRRDAQIDRLLGAVDSRPPVDWRPRPAWP